jgi:hypothetical protein
MDELDWLGLQTLLLTLDGLAIGFAARQIWDRRAKRRARSRRMWVGFPLR